MFTERRGLKFTALATATVVAGGGIALGIHAERDRQAAEARAQAKTAQVAIAERFLGCSIKSITATAGPNPNSPSYDSFEKQEGLKITLNVPESTAALAGLEKYAAKGTAVTWMPPELVTRATTLKTSTLDSHEAGGPASPYSMFDSLTVNDRTSEVIVYPTLDDEPGTSFYLGVDESAMSGRVSQGDWSETGERAFCGEITKQADGEWKSSGDIPTASLNITETYTTKPGEMPVVPFAFHINGQY